MELFEIISMLTERDIIIIPDLSNWTNNQDIFSSDERTEIIFLLERIAWKRDIKIVEMDVHPCVNKKIRINDGMIELTDGYMKLAKENLFDTDSKLNKDQVKEIYCKLEKRFAESAQGIVKIPREILIKGSIVNEITIPALKNNEKVKISII